MPILQLNNDFNCLTVGTVEGGLRAGALYVVDGSPEKRPVFLTTVLPDQLLYIV